MNAPFWISIALGSVLGSPHCAAMCGPFVACYAGQRGEESSSRASGLRAAFGYHAARFAVYVALGALAGAVGTAVDDVAARAGVARAAAWLAGVLIVASGLVQIASSSSRGRRWRERFISRIVRERRFFGARSALVQLGRAPRVVRATGLGLLTPLLPCGFLYTFVLLAAGTGSVVQGGLVFAVLWLGTAPALLGVGALSGALSRRWGERAQRSLGFVLVLAGVAGLLFRAQLPLSTQESAAGVPNATSASPAELAKPRCH